MICKSCGKKYKYKETGNMGDDMKKSGWASMINHDMKCFWYCKECIAILKVHFKIVYDILKDDYIAYSWLIRLIESGDDE